MPAFSITAAHLAISLFMRSVIASGVLPRISMPSLLTFSWISGLGKTSLMARVRTGRGLRWLPLVKNPVFVSVLALTAFAVFERSAAARNYLHCVSRKVVIVDAPKGTTSSSTEENFDFWIDEATKVVTLADGKKLNVGRFDDRWISAVSGDVSYELDRQNGNLSYAGSTMKDGIATTIIGAGRCTVAPAR
jgi:hypothetical protein